MLPQVVDFVVVYEVGNMFAGRISNAMYILSTNINFDSIYCPPTAGKVCVRA